MAELIRIRIDYFGRVEETDAMPLGPDPEGRGELFRVERPSMAIGNVTRQDVVVLDCRDDPPRFLDVVEESTWKTYRPLVPREAADTAAFAEFRRAIEAAGCLFEGQASTTDAVRIVVSAPAGVPIERWGPAFETMIRQTAGTSHAEFQARLEAKVLEREAADRARRVRASAATRRRRIMVEALHLARFVGVVGLVVAAAAWCVARFLAAAPSDRPTLAAIAMLAFQIPLWLGLGERDPGARFGPSAFALLALVLAQGIDRPLVAAGAVVLGLGYALFLGAMGAIVTLFSGFSRNGQEAMRLIFFTGLPNILSALAAVGYAVSVGWAGDSFGGLGVWVRGAGLVISALILLPALRKRDRRPLLSILFSLAVVWGLVWLLGGLR